MEFVNKVAGLRLQISKRKVKMNVCSIWPFAQISDDFYYLDIVATSPVALRSFCDSPRTGCA